MYMYIIVYIHTVYENDLYLPNGPVMILMGLAHVYTKPLADDRDFELRAQSGTSSTFSASWVSSDCEKRPLLYSCMAGRNGRNRQIISNCWRRAEPQVFLGETSEFGASICSKISQKSWGCEPNANGNRTDIL